MRKQVGPFADQTLVGAIRRAFGAWAAEIRKTETEVDVLDQKVVESALRHFDKNLTVDGANHHTDYLYPYKRAGSHRDHYKVCKLRPGRVIRIQEQEETEDPSSLTEKGILD